MILKANGEREAPLRILIISIVVLAALGAQGCYTTRDVMLRNPAHLPVGAPAVTDPAAEKLMSDPTQLSSFPPGHLDSALSYNQAIWRMEESRPTRITTIFFDKNKHLNPISYLWVGEALEVMVSRDYEIRTYRIRSTNIDSLAVNYTFYDNQNTLKAGVFGLGAIVSLVLLIALSK